MMEEIDEKRAALELRMAEYGREDVCVAFSGGVDSSLLLAKAVKAAQAGTRVYAVTFRTRLHPMGDMEIASQVAAELGAVHRIIDVDELEQAGIRNNPRNRCYLCKKCLFQKLKEFAAEQGISICLEGTNSDDLNVYRPGLQALRELEIVSPLAELGISKAQVRQLAQEEGVSVAQRPSSPCMATRLPYGAELDYELLKKVDIGETWLRQQLGGGNVRLRIHGTLARIEVDPVDLPRVVDTAETVVRKMKELGFPYVTLDLQGFRSGSMDEL